MAFAQSLVGFAPKALPARGCDCRITGRTSAQHVFLHEKPERSLLRVNASETVTDQSVPEGHKGLHGFLYGEEGAEAHEDDVISNESEQGKALNGKRVPVKIYLDSKFGVKKAGVYAVINDGNVVQYVGFARSLHTSLKVHSAAVGPAKCSFVEARPLPPQAVANRARLQAEAEKWLAELGSVPPGNAHEKHLWEAKVVTDTETFEEKKLKLQKAMGENLGDASADPSAEQRRQNLMAAVSQDDWSSVIDAQTQETITPPSEQSAEPSSSPANPGPASPFSTAHVQQGIGERQEEQPMTPETVDKALDEVRPFLIADGGNVEVVDVAEGIVSLRLQGACGTCASSASTMKLGIERALKAAFGDAMKEVKQVDAKDTSTTVFSVNSHLDMLRPAIKSYGGSVEVMEIAGGQCKIQYNGPPTIGAGITAAIKNQFPDITDVLITA